MSPYLLLGISPSASDAQIRQAYLTAIKVSSPETDPERFQQLAAAYEAVKDDAARQRHYLLNDDPGGDSPWEAFANHVRSQPRFEPPPFETMKQFLRACTKR